jgi:hypothetical protein
MRPRKKKAIRLISAVENVDGTWKLLLKSGDMMVVEYPDSWPSENKRAKGVITLIDEKSGNTYLWDEYYGQHIGVNFKTAQKHGLRLLSEVTDAT